MSEEQTGDDAAGPAPPEHLFQRAQFNWLALAMMVSAVLGAVVLFAWNQRRVRADDREFYDSLGATQFKFEPHESTQRFRQLRESLRDDETPEATRQLQLALFDRALNNVPQILKFQEESTATQTMYSKSMISTSAWRSFRENEALVSQELEEVSIHRSRCPQQADSVLLTPCSEFCTRHTICANALHACTFRVLSADLPESDSARHNLSPWLSRYTLAGRSI